MAHYGSSGEARHIQLVQDTAKGILECLQSSSSKTSLLRSLAEQRPWHELLHHFGELSRLLKGRQGTAQHEDSETSLWTQSLLDQFVLEPREVREPYCRSRRVLTCGLTGCDAGATERPSGPSEPLHARNTSRCAAVLHCVAFGRPDVHGVCWCAVSDLLLTKLLPEMEAQRPGMSGAERAASVPASCTRESLPESIGALKTRVSSYNALLDDALKDMASVQAEEGDRSIDGAAAASLPRDAAVEQSMRVAKKQRV